MTDLPAYPYVADMPNVDPIPTAEAARLLDLDTSTVLRMAKSGAIPHAYKIPGRTGAYIFDRQQIERLAAKRATDRRAAS